MNTPLPVALVFNQ